MSKYATRFFLLCFISYVIPSFGQIPNIVKGRETMKADVNFTELSNLYQEHPQPIVRKMPMEEDEGGRPSHTDIYLSRIFLYQPHHSSQRAMSVSTPMPVSIAPADTFITVTTDGSEIPPDTHGAVDTHYVVTAVNPEINIQTRAGRTIRGIGLDFLFTSVLPHGNGSFDPRIHYDPYTQRWIVAALAYGQTAQAQIMIGASVTNNPNGAWHLFSFPVDPTGANWLDFDNIGFNKQWIVLCGNWFSNSGGGGVGGAEIYAFNKDSILAGTGAPYTAFYKSDGFSISPAITYDTTAGLFLLETYDETRGAMRLQEITGTADSPILNLIGYPSAPITWSSAGNMSESDFAPQKGTTHKIQTGDDRVYNLSERNGKVWASHCIFLPSGGPRRSSIMWWEIDTSGTVNQNAIIDDPTTTNGNFYAYPSMAVNQYGDAIIGYSVFNKLTYPNAGYSIHMHNDPPDSLRHTYTFKHGLNNYFQNFGGGQNRWGDYSGTCIDPVNNTDFWTIQESVPASPANFWNTWWAKVHLCFTYDTLHTTSQLLNTAGAVDTISVTGLNSSGATYTWNFAGGTGTSDTGAGPQVVTFSTTGLKIVSVTITATGGCSTTLYDTIIQTCAVADTVMLSTHAVNPGSNDTIRLSGINTPSPVFTWSFSGGTATPGTGFGTQVVNWSTPGVQVVSLTITTDSGCTATYTDTVLVCYVNDALVSTNNLLNPTLSDTISITGGNFAGATYTWNFSGGTATPGTGAGPQVITWGSTGAKVVIVTITNGGCSTTITDSVFVFNVGVPIVNMDSRQIDVLPNPNNGDFKILFSQNVVKPFDISIADMAGKVVYVQHIATIGSRQYAISTNHIAPGNYNLNINIDNQVYSHKLTVVK